MISVDQILAQRYPASFEGIPFDVAESERSSGNHTTRVPVVGRGTRSKITIGGDIDTWRITGWLRRDEGPWADQSVLASALRLGHDHDRTGTYIDPFDGPQTVVPKEWRFGRRSEDLNAVSLSITFEGATLDPVATPPGFLASSPLEFEALVIRASPELANEPAPAAQLEALRTTLGIRPSVQGEDYAAAATGRLLAGGNVTTAGTPAIIQDLGIAGRAAASGEYAWGAWSALRARIMAEAARSNSPTLLQLREIHSLYVSALGADAFGRSESKPGRSLLTVGLERTFAERLKRNRDAVRGWLIRDRVNL
jgi:hypothetical protein